MASSSTEGSSNKAADGRVLIACLVDFLLVWFTSVVLCTSMYERFSGDAPKVAMLGMAIVLGVPSVYGLLCFSGHTIGTLIAGTRIVKIKDGSAPGLWSVTMMLARTVFIPFAPLFFIISLFSESGTSSSDWDFEQWHTSVDKKLTAAASKQSA